METNKRLLLVMNPCSGQRRANRVLPEIIRALEDGGWQTQVHVTRSEGDATDYIAVHASEFDRVVCIGGDGTLNETISGLLKSGVSVPIGYVPGGTTNDYATSLGLSTDPVIAARDAAGERGLQLDIGTFNGRGFIYTAAFGAFARVAYSTPQSMKNALGHFAYVLAGISDLGSLRPYHLHVSAEGLDLEEDFIFCCVTNSLSVGGVLKLDVDLSALSDGVFEVMLVRCPTQPMELHQILTALASGDPACEMIHFFKTRELRISCEDPMEWTLDGERAEPVSETHIRNLHDVATLIIPEARTEETLPNDTEEELSD